jgi:hypothetical protein
LIDATAVDVVVVVEIAARAVVVDEADVIATTATIVVTVVETAMIEVDVVTEMIHLMRMMIGSQHIWAMILETASHVVVEVVEDTATASEVRAAARVVKVATGVVVDVSVSQESL